MKPGVAIEAAEADLAAIADGLAREFPQTNKGRGVMLGPLHDSMIGSDLKLTFDIRVVGFCAGAALLVGLLFGVMPAWHATHFSAAEVIGSESRTMTGGGGTLRGLLVMGEVATAVLLLFGAGLRLRTLVAVESFDRGYRADSVLSMLVDPLGSKYPTPESLQQFFDQVEAEILAVPGVKAVGWTSSVPLGPDQLDGYSFEIVGDPPLAEGQRPNINYQVASPGYFSALELPIVEGRAFDRRDTRAAIGRIDKEQLVSLHTVRTLEDIEWEVTASTSDVLRLVIGNAVQVVVTGAVIGLILSALLGRLIATMLFGVQPLDLTTFALVTIVLALTAAVSIAGPAWRATRIDPAVALRNQ